MSASAPSPRSARRSRVLRGTLRGQTTALAQVVTDASGRYTNALTCVEALKPLIHSGKEYGVTSFIRSISDVERREKFLRNLGTLSAGRAA